MFLLQVLVLLRLSSSLSSQKVATSFSSKFSQKYTRFSSSWDSLSSSISRILFRTQSISLSRVHRLQKASSQKSSAVLYVLNGSRQLAQVVSDVQSASQFLPSTSTVRFSWAKILTEYFNHFKKKWFFLFIRVILIV